MATNRHIVARFRVQPGLNVIVEESMNIMLEVTSPQGDFIATSGPISDVDLVTRQLQTARVWVAAAEDDLWSRQRNKEQGVI